MSDLRPDVFREMLDAFWEFLAAEKTYTNLGLREFRLYDGKELLPIEGLQGQGLSFRRDDLPAIACTDIAVTPTVTGTPATIDLTVTLSCAFVFEAEGDFADSLNVTRAMEALLSTAYRPVAMMSGLDGSGRVAQAIIKPSRIARPRDPNTGEITHWIWHFDVDLKRGFRPRLSEE